MTNVETLKLLTYYVENGDSFYSGYKVQHDALEIAVECIKLQIPKKPTHIDYMTIKGGYDKCPNCGTLIIDSYRYCHGCGQKIDRGENE